jgi:hypothetical protein
MLCKTNKMHSRTSISRVNSGNAVEGPCEIRKQEGYQHGQFLMSLVAHYAPRTRWARQ